LTETRQEEIPVILIVALFEIEFQNKALFVFYSSIMEDHHSIHNISFCNEPSLASINQPVHNFLQPKHESFGEDLVNNVEQTYRSVLLDFISILDFGKKGNNPIVKPFNVQIMIMKLLMSSLIKSQQCW
jgi:hypothetical protein